MNNLENIKIPKVSVVITSWNRSKFIGKSIQSVIDQTLEDWELIFIDDGSTDNTKEVVAEYIRKDSRIKYFQINHVGRISVVSNVALREAKGEFIAILDDDDWWIDEEKLEKQVKFLDEHRDYIACGGWFITVDAEGEEILKIKKPEDNESIRHIALFANPIANSTAMFRREVGIYDETLRQFADWDFWLKIGKKGKLYNFHEYFLAYRMWNEGSSFVHQKENARAAISIVSRYRFDYPGFLKALVLVRLYWFYSMLPLFVRRPINRFLSQIKKRIFSK